MEAKVSVGSTGIFGSLRLTTLFAAMIVLTAFAPPSNATQRALLIGVGDYEGTLADLDGPPHDVVAMREILTDRLGFESRHIVALVDKAATHQGILDGLDALVQDVEHGDFAFIYLSGHGTSAYDAAGAELALVADTGAFVPSDFPFTGSDEDKRETLLIGTRDVRPRLEAIDERGVSGMVVVDSCFAENSTRSMYGNEEFTYRFVDSGLDHLGAFPTGTDASLARYPYRRLVTIAASGKREKAIDWGIRHQYLTHDGRPHGAFTDGLLRALRSLGSADSDHNGTVTNRELFNAVKSYMVQAQLPHSPKFQPVSNEDSGLADSPAFREAELVVAPQPPGRPLRIFVAGSLPLVRAAVAEDATLTAAIDQNHDLRVERVDRANGDVRLTTPYGDQVLLAASERAAADALRQQPRIRHLVGSANALQRFRVDLPGLRGETFVEDEKLDLSISSDRSAYLLVLAVAPDGTFRVLYPWGTFDPVDAGTKVPFRTVVNAPFGIDHVVAVAFLQRPPFYDKHLVEGEVIYPGTSLHEALRMALTADDPNQARAVSRVVTVPIRAVGG